MRIGAGIVGDIAGAMAAEVKAGEEAVTAAMSEASGDLKMRWRQQITQAGLGRRLSNSIQSQVYPKGETSLNAAGFVWSNAPKIIAAHAEGPLIRGKDGFWLAIPLPAAGKGRGGRRITPLEWERKTGLGLRFVYRKGKPGLLVADKARISKAGYAVKSRAKTGRNQVTAPIFVLVPQVKLKKRLDLDGPTRSVSGRIPKLIVDKWLEGKVR